jgi:hypothetical protein
MAACHVCGARFFPQASAWSPETCGECIAAEIELGLVGALLQGQRRPLHRLGHAPAGVAAPVLEALENALQRRVGNA